MKFLSIIIPVFKEENINNLISHLESRVDFKSTEIIVVDGDENGSTVRDIKNKRVIRLISRKGRARQMNFGAMHAKGDVFLFLHADTFLPQSPFELMKRTFKSPEIKAGAFDLGIDSDKLPLKIIERTASLRSRITSIPYGDQAIFIRRNIFFEIGAYTEIPLMEDIDLFLKLKKRKYSISILKEKVLTSPRRWLENGIFFCSLRNIVLAFLFYMGVNAKRLARYY